MSKQHSITFELAPVDNSRQANLCGPMDDNLRTIERRLGVEISYRGHEFKIIGQERNVSAVEQMLKSLYLETK